MSYADHTPWSDPGLYRDRLAVLPTEPLALADALENFLIHHAAARFLKFGVPDYAETDRGLRTIQRLLGTAFERDDRPLSEQRALSAYLYGTCHDFVLIAASVFRSNGIEARLRVGFVNYFRPDRWEDHWLCEYRHDGEWRLLDAQLGLRAREGHGITFDVTDVPRDRFRSGPQLWREIRSGKIDAETCGLFYAGISGDWFPASNVLKDAAALAGIETLPWDYWGPGRECSRLQAVPDDAYAQFDALADATVDPPETPEAAQAVFEAYPWAKPGDTVLSVLVGGTQEQRFI